MNVRRGVIGLGGLWGALALAWWSVQAFLVVLAAVFAVLISGGVFMAFADDSEDLP